MASLPAAQRVGASTSSSVSCSGSWRSRPIPRASNASSIRPLRRSDPPPKPTGEGAAFLADVVAGLGRSPKTLPAKYMFDAVGSRIFACLASGEAFEATRLELAILREHGREIAAAIGPNAQVERTFTDPDRRYALVLLGT